MSNLIVLCSNITELQLMLNGKFAKKRKVHRVAIWKLLMLGDDCIVVTCGTCDALLACQIKFKYMKILRNGRHLKIAEFQLFQISMRCHPW